MASPPSSKEDVGNTTASPTLACSAVLPSTLLAMRALPFKQVAAGSIPVGSTQGALVKWYRREVLSLESRVRLPYALLQGAGNQNDQEDQDDGAEADIHKGSLPFQDDVMAHDWLLPSSWGFESLSWSRWVSGRNGIDGSLQSCTSRFKSGLALHLSRVCSSVGTSATLPRSRPRVRAPPHTLMRMSSNG